MNQPQIKTRSIAFIVAFSVLLLSFSMAFAQAQYASEQNIDVTIPSSGVFHAETSSVVGISIDVDGAPGATGTVSTAVYSGNPQPDASIPDNVGLNHFVVVTFNMAASDFHQATIVISYTDADVSGISTPYNLYKYIPSSNSYTLLPATIDTTAKTITVTLLSTADPLFAIGGQPASTQSPTNVWLWVGVVVVVVVIVLLAVLILRSRSD